MLINSGNDEDNVWWHIVATCILKYWSDSEISERFQKRILYKRKKTTLQCLEKSP